jgi:hypothetical protein
MLPREAAAPVGKEKFMAKKKKVAKKAPNKTTAKKKPAKAKKPAPKPKKTTTTAPRATPAVITHEMIAKRAYELWLKKSHGAHSNNSVQNWLEAESELRASARK